jgi:hypothetical protein
VDDFPCKGYPIIWKIRKMDHRWSKRISKMNMLYLAAVIFGNQFWTLPQRIHHCGTPRAPLAPVMKTPGSCDIPVVYKQGSLLEGQITTNFQQNSIPFLSMSTKTRKHFLIKKRAKNVMALSLKQYYHQLRHVPFILILLFKMIHLLETM